LTVEQRRTPFGTIAPKPVSGTQSLSRFSQQNFLVAHKRLAELSPGLVQQLVPRVEERRAVGVAVWQVLGSLEKAVEFLPRSFVIVPSGCEFIVGSIMLILRPAFDANRRAVNEQFRFRSAL
jgi:hypothetical protein